MLLVYHILWFCAIFLQMIAKVKKFAHLIQSSFEFFFICSCKITCKSMWILRNIQIYASVSYPTPLEIIGWPQTILKILFNEIAPKCMFSRGGGVTCFFSNDGGVIKFFDHQKDVGSQKYAEVRSEIHNPLFQRKWWPLKTICKKIVLHQGVSDTTVPMYVFINI